MLVGQPSQAEKVIIYIGLHNDTEQTESLPQKLVFGFLKVKDRKLKLFFEEDV